MYKFSSLHQDVIAEQIAEQVAEAYLAERDWQKRVDNSDVVQPWGGIDIHGIKDKKLKTDKAEELYNKYYGMVKETEAKFKRVLTTSTKKIQNAKVLVDIKKIGSFVDKVVGRGKNPQTMNDFLRGAILVRDEADIEPLIKEIFKNAESVREFDKKEKGGDKKYGYYGSYHLAITVNGIVCELQIMTQKLWAYKKVGHDIYVELRSDSGSLTDKEIKAKFKTSKDIFWKGNQPRSKK